MCTLHVCVGSTAEDTDRVTESGVHQVSCWRNIFNCNSDALCCTWLVETIRKVNIFYLALDLVSHHIVSAS